MIRSILLALMQTRKFKIAAVVVSVVVGLIVTSGGPGDLAGSATHAPGETWAVGETTYVEPTAEQRANSDWMLENCGAHGCSPPSPRPAAEQAVTTCVVSSPCWQPHWMYRSTKPPEGWGDMESDPVIASQNLAHWLMNDADDFRQHPQDLISYHGLLSSVSRGIYLIGVWHEEDCAQSNGYYAGDHTLRDERIIAFTSYWPTAVFNMAMSAQKMADCISKRQGDPAMSKRIAANNAAYGW